MKRLHPGALLLSAAVLACEPGARSHDPASAPQSSTIGALSDGTIVALDADHDALVFLGRNGGQPQSVAVGRAPSQLTVRGDMVAVSNRYGRSVSLVSTRDRTVLRTINVGVEPVGLAFLPDGRLAVALAGEQALAIVDVNAGAVTERMALRHANPRAVAVLPDGKIYVTHTLKGELSVVRPDQSSVEALPVELRVPSTPLNASLLTNLTVSPDGNELSTTHVNLNNESLRPDPNQGGGGYQGTPEQLPGVNPTVTLVDPGRDVMVSDATAQDEPMMRDGCFEGCGASPQPATAQDDQDSQPTSALLSNRNGQLQGRQINEPVASAYLDGGRGFAVLGRGSRNVMIWRRDERGNRKELVKVVSVGHGADGLAVTPDGKQLLVHNAFDLTVDVIDVPLFDDEKTAQGGMLRSPRASEPVKKVGVADERPAATLKIADVTLPANVQEGRKLFFDATNASMTGLSNGAMGISCGTCHVDGRNDGRNWQFIDGPRNTPSLAGAAPGRTGIATTTAPLHWGGELENHRALQRTVTEFMGGSGLSANQLDQLAAFIDTIPEPDNVYRTKEELLAQLQRGEELFHDPVVGCTECHQGEHRTDNRSWDVGTGMRVQTPVLHGVHLTAPYLHDGSAPTLEDLLDRLVRSNLMGRGDHLSDDDMAALAAYLRSL
ncbi:MAG: c-type cytochrome [Myxococcota bacterium]